MGLAPAAKIDRWVTAAGYSTAFVNPSVRERIIIAAKFIENSATRADASSLLQGIDFSCPVEVWNSLPDRVFVQFVDHHLGFWFTDTGVTPDRIGLSSRGRTRRCFRPRGSVAALKSTAKGIKDHWSESALPMSLHPESGRMGEMTSGGGTQYLVIDRFQMEEI